ncbi:ABC transporter permease [Modestobacter roseus]|uniref:Autoinducer 2 import system permease protein LsrC n=1 Tax=Modestobacter roseus TaxID=1181884 RepID=A0A562IPA0_9ACTN|nr:ABC transporter permease [Modestobacter roseus]MQA34383.1 ABC transporter permease [Modestobacter roseus]TWH72710.1 monosaccharide ABC transporter membrane protein, CUT2 family (TC 3.A.1.2.-) [Modestobacter roseus]
MSSSEVTTNQKRLRLLSFRNISAIYIFVFIFVVFSLVTPQTFLQEGVWRTLLDAQAITVIAAIGVMIPLVTGSFNLAIGAEVGFAGILVAVLQVKAGIPFAMAIPLTLLAGALVGLVSGLIITKGRIDSFIATLGLSSILLAALAWMSSSQQVVGLQEGFRSIATSRLLGITVPAYVMLVLAFVVWYVLERTPVGRRMYAAGYNPDGARLAGVHVVRLRIGALVAGGAIAAMAGVLLTSRLNTGEPTVGPGLLLPALTAVFLGSTQFKGGRFNVWGTVIAVYVLATGIKGLQLIGGPPWISDLFNGIALLAAVGLSQWEKPSARTGAIRRAFPFGRRQGGDEAEGSAPPAPERAESLTR